MNQSWKKRLLWILIFISCIPILTNTFFSRPCTDDFCYSIATHAVVSQNSWNVVDLISAAIETDSQFYNGWQGLYSSAFILSLQPGIFGSELYGIGAVLLFLFSYFCVCYFLYSIKVYLSLDNIPVPLSAMFIISFLYNWLPSLTQGLYWFNGAWNYVFFFFLTLLNIALILQYQKNQSLRYVVACVCLSFVISGGNHITSVLNLILLFLFSLGSFPRNKVLCLPLVVAIIGFLIMYFAPGTQVRQASCIKAGVLDTIIHGYYHGVLMILKWSCSLPFIIYVGIIAIYSLLRHSAFTNVKISSKLLGAGVLVLCFIIGGLYCIPYYAMSYYGEPRLDNVIWFFFVMAITMLIPFFISYLMAMNRIKGFVHCIERKRWIKVVAIMFILYAPESSFFESLTHQLTGSSEKYAQSFDLRIKETMENRSSGITVIVYSQQLFDDNLLFYGDLTTEENDWRNVAWVKYYGITSATLKDK